MRNSETSDGAHAKPAEVIKEICAIRLGRLARGQACNRSHAPNRIMRMHSGHHILASNFHALAWFQLYSFAKAYNVTSDRLM